MRFMMLVKTTGEFSGPPPQALIDAINKQGEAAVKSAAIAMQRAGMLSPTTDVQALAKRAFVHLDGVTDEWLKSLQVEKVAGGQLPPDEDIRLRIELATSGDPWCGDSCCNIANK